MTNTNGGQLPWLCYVTYEPRQTLMYVSGTWAARSVKAKAAQNLTVMPRIGPRIVVFHLNCWLPLPVA